MLEIVILCLVLLDVIFSWAIVLLIYKEFPEQKDLFYLIAMLLFVPLFLPACLAVCFIKSFFERG